MEKLTNRKCIYISSAIESGMSVLLEISKINLKKGDIVVITIQHADGSVYAYTPSVFRGFGKRLDMYKYLKCPSSFTVDEKIKYYKDTNSSNFDFEINSNNNNLNTINNIGSWPYADPQYHLCGDIPERVDMFNLLYSTQLIMAAIMDIDEAGSSAFLS